MGAAGIVKRRAMKVLDTRLPGVKRIELPVFRDDRGYFLETHRAESYAAQLDSSAVFVQDNCSHSRRGVLRGLHYQARHPQGKLIHVLHGEIFDVAVDVRPDSPGFGRWEGLVLSGEPRESPAGPAVQTQLWIPPGFAHGFVVLSDSATVHYKCTDYYRPDDQVCLRWDDPDLAIDWPVKVPVLSAQDSRGRTLKDLC
jgi:dTDP-4-dehydrorhamnose 3,5-epimerase